jgi:hypothetical protein
MSLEEKIKMTFEIEYKSEVNDRAFVLARQLKKGEYFALSENPTLGGIKIIRHIGMPRATDKEGKTRLDGFVFTLKIKSDADRFQVGQIVELVE